MRTSKPFAAVLLLSLLLCTACQPKKDAEKEPVFYPTLNNDWIGLGIAYGPYRDGQSPAKSSVPSEQDILEDLTILTTQDNVKWHLIRMYAADGASEQVLRTIRKHDLPVKVMQGAWLTSTEPAEYNEDQISEVIRLANEYPDIIVSVNLGNEIFVDWSAHKLPLEQIPQYIRWVDQVRNSTNVPVTLADDYNFWNKPHSQQVAQSLDFIVLHAYAMWNSQTLENALPWTQNVLSDIQERHPTKQIVLGESGWATSSVSSNGDERLIIAEASEDAQAVFFKQYYTWLKDNKIASFYFQSFDEKWKGGDDKPNAIAEKNWGLYRSDRSPKKAVKVVFN